MLSIQFPYGFLYFGLPYNLADMVFMPVIGTGSLYGVMNHTALWILAV